jgi:hypothetical protein
MLLNLTMGHDKVLAHPLTIQEPAVRKRTPDRRLSEPIPSIIQYATLMY